MSNHPIKTVTITGAAGQIGYALLFRIASGAMFGPETKVRLRLLELEPALPALHGVRMELEDCAFPLLDDIVCTSDVNEAMRGTNWALLVGAVPRKQGMERADLLKINGGIFINQGQAINDHAAEDVKILVVGNPCNTNCLVAMKNAPRVPKENFFAMTMLDQLRACTQLAQKANVHVNDVYNMTIWGNHSATQYPDFYHASINGKLIPDAIHDEAWLQNEFIPIVQQRGAAIIQARGLSSAASAANAIIQSVRSVTFPTRKNDSYSMAICSQGQYGVDEDLIFSFPCVTNEQGKIQVVENIGHNEFGKDKFNATLNELRAEREAIKALGLIK